MVNSSTLGERLRKSAHTTRYAWWAQIPGLSGVVARHHAPRTRPVLLLSLPRSGSSWVGKVLGAAENAAYLREPVTQGLKDEMSGGIVRNILGDTLGQHYRSAAHSALRGIPRFSRNIATSPEQWGLLGRSRRIVVIKEVNPLALPVYIEEARPYVILLLRHPAAVALSHQKLGWLGNPDTVAGSPSDGDVWLRNGWRQAEVIASALRTLSTYDGHCVIRYEDMCLAPEKEFKRVARETGLQFGPDLEREISRTTSGTGDKGDYSVQRDYRRIAWRWRQEIDSGALRNLREGYRRVPTGYYEGDDEWQSF